MRIAIALASLILLAGCATSAQMSGKGQSGFQTDAEYVAYVEANAKRRGIEVVWINPPQKRPDASEAR